MAGNVLDFMLITAINSLTTVLNRTFKVGVIATEVAIIVAFRGVASPNCQAFGNLLYRNREIVFVASMSFCCPSPSQSRYVLFLSVNNKF